MGKRTVYFRLYQRIRRQKNREKMNVRAREDSRRYRAKIGPEVVNRRFREAYAAAPDKFRERARNWRTENRHTWLESKRSSRIKAVLRELGLNKEHMIQALDAQKNRCAICLAPFTDADRPRIDHCHEARKFRGLLCNRCNPGLGMFGDDPKRLRRAARYLENFSRAVTSVT